MRCFFTKLGENSTELPFPRPTVSCASFMIVQLINVTVFLPWGSPCTAKRVLHKFNHWNVRVLAIGSQDSALIGTTSRWKSEGQDLCHRASGPIGVWWEFGACKVSSSGPLVVSLHVKHIGVRILVSRWCVKDVVYFRVEVCGKAELAVAVDYHGTFSVHPVFF